MLIHCKYDEMMSLEVLDQKRNPKNPNKHKKEQVERLAKIFKYQGIRWPIVISKRSGFITKGHGRLMAAHLCELKEFPVHYQEYKDEAQEYSDMISDNSIASWAELSLEEINAEFVNFGPDLDLDVFGIENFKVDVAEHGSQKTLSFKIPAEAEESFISRMNAKKLELGLDTHFKLFDRLLG